tara:strand:- start:956 stop:1510 length:555 start_codon:yes stop_codon:yes gene_type:complete
MGQSYSRNDGICRIEYESMRDRCTGLERANEGLQNVITEREESARQMRTRLSKTKADLDSTQRNFIGMEKQLRELQDKHSLVRPQLESLKVAAAEARHDAAASAEEASKLKLSNTALEDQAATATSRLASLREEAERAEKSNSATTDALRAKNTELREQLRGQQEELASLKKSIAMINNIVDST